MLHSTQVENLEFVGFNVVLAKEGEDVKQGMHNRVKCPPSLFGEMRKLPTGIIIEIVPHKRRVTFIRVCWAVLAQGFTLINQPHACLRAGTAGNNRVWNCIYKRQSELTYNDNMLTVKQIKGATTLIAD